jgi:hypothetical protein
MPAISLLGYAVLAVLTAHEACFALRHLTCKPAHCDCPVSHKFLAGLPLHGHTVTDATYWRPANKDLTQAKTVGPWLKLPGWKRRVIRTGPLVAVAGVLVNWWVAAAVLAVLVPLLAAAFSGRVRCLLRRGRLWGRLRHRDRVQTMGMLLSTITGTSASSVEAGVTWCPDYASAEPGDEVVRWVLPRGFKATGGEKSAAQEVWQSRIGFQLTFSWETQDTDEPVLVMRRAREMPSKVYLSDVLAKVEALPDHKTAIGLDDQGNLVCWDWSCENPHGMVVAGSRHGKTELNRSITAQVVRKGGRVCAVDCKRISFQGLEGVPGFELRNNPRDIRGMWELIEEFYEEMERRSMERELNPTVEFKRWLLIIEEVLQFSAMTDDWWEEMEPEAEADAGTLFWKPKRGKKTPRVWRLIKSLCWEGAEFGMHVIVDGQDGEFQALKGVRNVLGMRLLGGYQPQQWKACVGTTPVPEAPSTKGRFCLVAGGQTWVQALLGHEDKNESAAIWRDFARAGRRMDGTVPVTEGAAEAVILEGSALVNGDQAAGQRVFAVAPAGVVTGSGDPRGEPVSLSEAVEGGYVPGATVQALRQDRYLSDKGKLPDGLEFPLPVAEVRPGQTERFWSTELAEFNAARRGRRVA